jgi:hypothetical protein
MGWISDPIEFQPNSVLKLPELFSNFLKIVATIPSLSKNLKVRSTPPKLTYLWQSEEHWVSSEQNHEKNFYYGKR